MISSSAVINLYSNSQICGIIFHLLLKIKNDQKLQDFRYHN